MRIAQAVVYRNQGAPAHVAQVHASMASDSTPGVVQGFITCLARGHHTKRPHHDV
jgi:hypothetical protein